MSPAFTPFMLRIILSAGALMILLPAYSQSHSAPLTTISPATIDKIAEKTAEKLLQKIKKPQRIAESINAKNKQNQSQPQAQTTDNLYAQSYRSGVKITRLGSGTIGGNYFVIGELLGGIISHPEGSLPCGQGGTCGVLNLQSQNVTSAGSIANLKALKAKRILTGLVQSDISYWAFTGTGLYTNKDKFTGLRAIASLYAEAVHIVVRKDANIRSVAEMVNKRVSVGARDSGTLLMTRLVLGAYQLTEDDIKPEYLNNQASIEKLQKGQLDAMFFTVGPPAPAITTLFEKSKDYQILTIDAQAQKKIFDQGHYFSPYTIKANTYKNVGDINTISVYALWLCRADADEKLIYQFTKALWHKSARQLLNSSFIGKQIDIDKSLDGIGIPLHPGAQKYYNEIGKRF